MSFSLESDSHVKNKIKIELDQSKYATKFDIKNIDGVDGSSSAKILI